MGFRYTLDGSKATGTVAPFDLMTFIPGAGNIVKVVGFQFGSQSANALGPVTFDFGSYSGDITGSALTLIPWDQLNALSPTTTAKYQTTGGNGSGFAYKMRWSAQQISHIGPVFFDKPFILPRGGSPNIWGVRKTIGADNFVWSFELYIEEG